MTMRASTFGRETSPPEVAVTGGNFAGAMRILRGLMLGPKYEAIISDIEKALNVSRRTAERIYAGQSVNTDTTLKVLLHETFGPPLLNESLSRLAPDRRVIVAKALMDAAEIVWHRERNQQIEREKGR